MQVVYPYTTQICAWTKFCQIKKCKAMAELKSKYIIKTLKVNTISSVITSPFLCEMILSTCVNKRRLAACRDARCSL